MTISSRQVLSEIARLRAVALVVVAAHILVSAAPADAASYVATDLYTATPRGNVADMATNGQMAGNIPGGSSQATVWNGPAGAATNLHLPQFIYSGAVATDGLQQVGYSVELESDPRFSTYHALLWNGTAGSVVDLSPPGFDLAAAEGVRDGQQIGFGRPIGGPLHSLLWSGTAASVVDLHPVGYTSSTGRDLRDGKQVGFAALPGTRNHAMLWSGTAESAVDLHPAGYFESFASAVGDGQQVGDAYLSFTEYHAMVWSGTAASAVDLHPPGFDLSRARDVLGGFQVGWGDFGGGTGRHALVWNATAASVVDLQQFLPGEFDVSAAFSIDAAGNIFGIAGDGINVHAIMWSPVPEPGSLALLAAGGLLLAAVVRYRGTFAA